jgi:hypothetical protein
MAVASLGGFGSAKGKRRREQFALIAESFVDEVCFVVNGLKL